MVPVEGIRPATDQEISSVRFVNRHRGKRESLLKNHALSVLEALSSDPVVLIDFGEPRSGKTYHEMNGFAAALRRTAREQGLEVQTATLDDPEERRAYLAARILPDSSQFV